MHFRERFTLLIDFDFFNLYLCSAHYFISNHLSVIVRLLFCSLKRINYRNQSNLPHMCLLMISNMSKNEYFNNL